MRHQHNLPTLTAVYCFNNGTGICKVLSGRFEFYMNSWTQQFLGPARPSKYVDESGVHQRIPVSYTISGKVLYADRPINWSRYFAGTKPTEYNLLSATSFNWCKYAPSNNWPYKASILDHDGKHRIYFFNRQSCIYNPETKELQHYNTRFLYKSKLFIDLDYNPTMWAMENNKAKEVRLVKHYRQYYKEMRWRLLENPSDRIRYFVEMSETGEKDSQRPFIRKWFYNSTTSKCVADHWFNEKRLPEYCGLEQTEISVYFPGPKPITKLYEIHLHGIPTKGVDNFYGVKWGWFFDPYTWSRDGFSFSATTTIPVEGKYDEFTVINLFSQYLGLPSLDYDEHYPTAYMAIYKIKYTQMKGWTEPNYDKHKVKVLNMNYVDDIAWLPQCKTILVIFGPLYSEYKLEEFNLDSKRPIGSIYDLGANEPINAFFAKDNELYFYHRLNFVAKHIYTCASTGRSNSSTNLVTAVKSSQYNFARGTHENSFDFMSRARPTINRAATNHHEEKFFYDVGMLRKELTIHDAPDAALFPWSPGENEPQGQQGLPWWIWLLIALGLLFLLIMFILGFITVRQRRRRRYLARTQRSGMPKTASRSSTATMRSGSSRSRFGPSATRRSVLSGAAGASPSQIRRSVSPSSPQFRRSLTSTQQSKSGSSSRSLSKSPSRSASRRSETGANSPRLSTKTSASSPSRRSLASSSKSASPRTPSSLSGSKRMSKKP
jgi:hypothetical protein